MVIMKKIKKTFFYLSLIVNCSLFTIHCFAAPVWDDNFFQAKERVPSMPGMGELAPGEWGWWGEDTYREYEKLMFDRFWHPDVDYEAFEWHTTRERLDNRNLILTDTRSCPFDDTMECKKWLATPRKVEFLREPKGYVPKTPPKTEEELRAEEMLRLKALKKEHCPIPEQRPNIWSDSLEFQNCPFETEEECRIWKAKPTVYETMKGPAGVSAARLADMMVLSCAGNPLTADMERASPIIQRYRALLAASRACCTSGMIYQLQTEGASRGMIYKIMVDDANFHQFGERCLMISDEEFSARSETAETAGLAASVRDGCLCRQREYFESLLAPFVSMADSSPEFAKDAFEWTYVDGLGRSVKVSINQDVNNVLERLYYCP